MCFFKKYRTSQPKKIIHTENFFFVHLYSFILIFLTLEVATHEVRTFGNVTLLYSGICFCGEG